MQAHHRRGSLLAMLLSAAQVAAQEELPPGAGVLTLEAQARQALARGEPSAAADAYLNLARGNPDDSRLWRLAVDALGQAGRYNDALDAVEEARRRFPDRTDLSTLLARAYVLKAESQLREGIRDAHLTFNYQEAARLAEEVLAKDARDRDARLILAECSYALGDSDAALVQARAAAAMFPDHPGGHAMTAKVLYPRFVELRQRLGEAGIDAKTRAELAQQANAIREQVLAAVDAAIAAAPDRAFPYKIRGDVYAWTGNAGQALRAYGEALARDPQAAVDHAWLRRTAGIDDLQRIYAGALATYRAGADADQARAASLAWYLGYALFTAERWADARSAFLEAVRANSAYLNSLYYVTLASYHLLDLRDAEAQAASYAYQAPVAFADLVRGLDDRQPTLDVLTFLAAQAFKADRKAQSCAINHVLALVEDTAEAWNNYAFMCRELGNAPDSLAAYERALAKEPDSPQLLNDLAVILHYHLPDPENLQRARGLYARAIELAQQQLAAGNLPAEAAARVQQALQDAESNLRKLRESTGG